MSVFQLRPADLETLLAQHAGEVTLLDVREAWEVQTASVQAMLPERVKWLHVPMREIPSRLNELNETQPLAVLCHHGSRSMHVCQYLAQNGFHETTLLNVAGGIDAWSRERDASVPIY
jgi:rhodanese-related sulfurtransferase